MENFFPAANIDDAYHACHPELPLEADDPRYVSLNPVRGGVDIAEVVARRIRRTKTPDFHRQLITGHRGSGKTTELKQLQEKLKQEKFFPVYIDVENLLDISDISYLDILIAIGKETFECAWDNRIEISDELLENLDDWFAERILTEEERSDVETTLKNQFGVDAKIPLLRILSAISGQISSGSSRKETIRRTMEQDLRVLIIRLNDLLDDLRLKLPKMGWKDLVIIIDGMEKMHYKLYADGQSSHSALFVEHAEQLKSPHAHVIYTVPISLHFNKNLGDSFSEADVIPMVPVIENKRNTGAAAAMQAMQRLVSCRIAIEAIFEQPESVSELIRFSGGSVRDLLRLIRFGCDETDEKISPAHIKSAQNRMAIEYDRLFRDEDLELLKEIHSTNELPVNDTVARLLHQRVVMEYMDSKGRWGTLHPAVLQSPRFPAALKRDEKRAKRKR